MRVLVQRIDHEHDRVDVALDDPVRDLDIAADRAGLETFNLEPDFSSEQLAGRARGDELALGQLIAIERGECHQVSLLAVVGDDRESRNA